MSRTIMDLKEFVQRKFQSNAQESNININELVIIDWNNGKEYLSINCKNQATGGTCVIFIPMIE